MATIKKATYTRSIPKAARIITKDGRRRRPTPAP